MIADATTPATAGLVISYSYGVDSTAILVGLHRRGIRPDAIVFADLGSEKQATYDYMATIDAWLAEIGFPPVTVVRYKPVRAPYTDIEGNMVQNCTLPGATFGRGSCSLKWKVEPMEKWAKAQPWIATAWDTGQRVTKVIGFEAEEGYRTRRACDRIHSDPAGSDRWAYWYPLQDWGWTRARCIEEIQAEGLPIPPKSACFFCPNQKTDEVHDLTDEERARIIRMELRAEPYNRKIGGLWRRPRKRDGRPASITEYIVQQGLGYSDLVELDEKDPQPLNPACNHARTGRTFREDGQDTYLSRIVGLTVGETTTL